MRKLFKKIAACALSAAMVMSFAGCGGSTTGTTSAANENDGAKTENTTDDANGAGQDAGSDGSNTGTAGGSGDFSLPATEFTKLMGNGINLGNTMEATGRTSSSAKGSAASSVTACETAWGQPITTKEMIQGMKESGFDTIRIPVAWTNMMDYANDDYTIAPEYLDRVEEIVNYAIDADMYVIVNDHWDGGWYGLFGQEDESLSAKAWNIYENMWQQVGERFKDYDEHVIFESANEELCTRLNDEIDGVEGILSESECYKTTNAINQKFVDIIRSQGSNNANRYLLIAGFGTNIDDTLDPRYEMPQDTADKKLMVSVHFYDPTSYCLYDVENWGTKEDYAAMAETLAKMEEFVEEGYGVIIGEYGALPIYDSATKTQTVKANTLEYTTAVLANCDIYNYVPVLWDCNGMYNKESCDMIDADVKALYKSCNKASEDGLSDDEIKANAETTLSALVENAAEGFELEETSAMAWIMYTSNDWGTTYIVGDVYDPSNASAAVVGTDVEITGAGTYTIGLDFSGVSGGYVSGTQFSAIGIGNGEILYPDYVIDIKSIKVNGEEIAFGRGFTCSDDGKCTRTNLYNQWVPDDQVDKAKARTVNGIKEGITAMIINPDDFSNMKTLEITFDFVAP